MVVVVAVDVEGMGAGGGVVVVVVAVVVVVVVGCLRKMLDNIWAFSLGSVNWVVLLLWSTK